MSDKIDAITPDAPSKISGNLKSASGAILETVGSVAGLPSFEQEGNTLKNKGDAEYTAAKAEGYAEGTKDRVSGKIDQVTGAITGDSAQELSGKAQLEKGSAQQKINEPST